MRIYNVDTDKKINKVILYLTSEEMGELKDSIDAILRNNKKHHHEHIPDSDFKKEITVCMYKEGDLSSFDERSKKLILYDE